MLCVRCSHELPPRADRCLRCFSLNPQNRSTARALRSDPPARAPKLPLRSDPPTRAPCLSIESDPPARAHALSIRSDPPARAPLSLSFQSDPAPAQPSAHEATTEPPDLSRPLASEPSFAVQVAAPAQGLEWSMGAAAEASPGLAPAGFAGPSAAEPLLASTPSLPTAQVISVPSPALPVQNLPQVRARLLAWSVDLALLLCCALLHVGLAALVVGPARLAPALSGSPDYWLDLLLFGRRLPALWALLAASLAVAYSFFFTFLGGRTPGMALLHLRLVREDGRRISPLFALLRAACALPSAGLCLFGFALALFDERGQTLHDKLLRTLVVASAAPLRGGAH